MVDKFNLKRLPLFLLAALAAIILIILGIINNALSATLLIMPGIVITWIIIKKPIIGLALILGIQPIITVFSNVPYLSSISTLLGGITFIGFLISIISRRKKVQKLEIGIWLSLLFVIWVVITNPTASLMGSDRNWFFTLIQLWLLAILSSTLVKKEIDHQIIIMIYLFCILITAVDVINNGSIGNSWRTSIRASGFSEGANTAARYLLLGIIFAFGALNIYSKKIEKILLVLLLGILIIALGYTVSRSGYLLLVLTIGLLLLAPSRSTIFRKIGYFMIFGGIVLQFLPDGVYTIASNEILSSLIGQTDTVGLRFSIWEVGWKMFTDNRIIGIGIGQFSEASYRYGVGFIPYYHLGLTAHDLYIQLLSETGIVGFLLFTSSFLIATINLFSRAIRNKDPIYWVWFCVIVVILVGGITKTELTNKILWVSLGLGSITEIKNLKPPFVPELFVKGNN